MIPGRVAAVLTERCRDGSDVNLQGSSWGIRDGYPSLCADCGIPHDSGVIRLSISVPYPSRQVPSHPYLHPPVSSVAGAQGRYGYVGTDLWDGYG